MYDLVLTESSRERYDELLMDCAHERRAMEIARVNGKDWGANLLLHLSTWLITTGVRLQERIDMRPSLSQP